MDSLDTLASDLETIRIRVAANLGWSVLEYNNSGVLVGHAPGHKDLKAVPSYARDIRAAWDIVERLTGQGIRVLVKNVSPQGAILIFSVEIGPLSHPLAMASADHAPRAICEAFLQLSETQRHKLEKTQATGSSLL